MSPQRSPLKGWGPSDQFSPATERKRRVQQALMIAALILCLRYPTPAIMLLSIGVAIRIALAFHRIRSSLQQRRSQKLAIGGDPLAAVLNRNIRGGGGTYLGLDLDGRWRLARPERAVLVLGPPRSGKSSAVIIPAILAHLGPAVSASTKPDVLAATAASRSRLGRVWEFDPTGGGALLGGAQLRWSPVSAARGWDGALLIARAMVAGAGVGVSTSDSTHWSKRACALLAPLLHAAALGRREIATVSGWVLGHELDEPGMLLERADARLAVAVLVGLINTEARERSSILSAAADALDAYTSTGALAAASNPNFDAHRFVRSRDTIYIHAAAEHQALAAPLVCGLLSEIRAATYQAHRQRALAGRVLFALDEAANIAPLGELPQIASDLDRWVTPPAPALKFC